MPRRRRLTHEEVRREKEKADRANLIVSMAVSDREFVQKTLEAFEESKRGESIPYEEFICQEAAERPAGYAGEVMHISWKCSSI
jgi:hypothetical protein